MSSPEQTSYYQTAHLDTDHVPQIQLVLACEIIDTMAQAFDVSPRLVRTIPVQTDDGARKQAAVVYVGDGLNRGDWPDIQSGPDSDFVFEVYDGIEVDARQAMTTTTFAGMVGVLNAQAQAAGDTYRPSLLPKARGNDIQRVHTWLTGHRTSPGDDTAPIGFIGADGEPHVIAYPLNGPSEIVGFRPAVIITPELIHQFAQVYPIDHDI